MSWFHGKDKEKTSVDTPTRVEEFVEVVNLWKVTHHAYRGYDSKTGQQTQEYTKTLVLATTKEEAEKIFNNIAEAKRKFPNRWSDAICILPARALVCKETNIEVIDVPTGGELENLP